MISKKEVLVALEAASHLVRLRPEGIERFDVSIDAFWKSFWAAVLVAPGYSLMIWVEHVYGQSDASIASVVLRGLIVYLLSWTSFPLLCLGLTLFFNLSGRFVPLVIANNWTSVWQMAIFIVAFLLTTILPTSVGQPLLVMAAVGVLYVQWFVIKTALGTTGLIALGFLTLSLILDQTLQLVFLG